MNPAANTLTAKQAEILAVYKALKASSKAKVYKAWLATNPTDSTPYEHAEKKYLVLHTLWNTFGEYEANVTVNTACRLGLV